MADVVAAGKVYSDKKVKYAEKLDVLINTLPKVLLITVDNVGSQQMHVVRAELRKEGQKAEILMGKNTMIKVNMRHCCCSLFVIFSRYIFRAVPVHHVLKTAKISCPADTLVLVQPKN
jgi:hypothetical protein